MNKQNKKILIVTPYMMPEGGGLENYAWQIAWQLRTSYEFQIICLSRQKTEKLINEEIKIERKKASFVVSNTPIKTGFLFNVLRAIKEFKPNLIHTHTPVPFASDMAALASIFKRLPLITTYHSGSLIKGNLLTDFLASPYMIWEKILLNRSNKIVAVSNHIKNQRLKKYQRKITVIPPGVELSTNPEAEVPYPERKGILIISPLKKEYAKIKGLPQLIEAVKLVAKEVPKVQLTVIGDGNERPLYEEMIQKSNLSDNVKLVGQVPHEQIWQYYQQADVIVVPSLGNVEGTPTVIFEAMAQKRPIVASRISGIPDIVRDGKNGILVQENNILQLAKALIDILNNPARAKNFGENGYELIKANYQWSNIASQYKELYDQILAKK